MPHCGHEQTHQGSSTRCDSSCEDHVSEAVKTYETRQEEVSDDFLAFDRGRVDGRASCLLCRRGGHCRAGSRFMGTFAFRSRGEAKAVNMSSEFSFDQTKCLPLELNRARRLHAKCSITCKTAIDTCSYPRLRAPGSPAHPAQRKSRDSHRNSSARDGRSRALRSVARCVGRSRVGVQHKFERRSYGYRSLAVLRSMANSMRTDARICSLRCYRQWKSRDERRRLPLGLGVSWNAYDSAGTSSHCNQCPANGCKQLLGARHLAICVRSVLVVAHGIPLRGGCECRAFADDFFGRNGVVLVTSTTGGAR